LIRPLIIAIVISFHFVGFAQISSKTDNDLEKFFEVGGDIFTQPTNFTSDDWIKLSATIGITGLSTLIDKDIQEFSQSNKSAFTDHLFKVDKYFHIESMIISIAAIYGYGVLADNENVRNLGLRLSETTFYSGLINLSTRFLIGRGRPNISESQYTFRPLDFTWGYSAFPSAHTTLAFAYSTVMAKEYNNFFWEFGWYSLSALVGFARIHNDQHWLSDVLMGAALGYFIGNFVNDHKTNQLNNNPGTVVPQPIVNFKIPFSF
jgi:membrane-associated phospholipid phosphatase